MTEICIYAPENLMYHNDEPKIGPDILQVASGRWYAFHIRLQF